MSEEISNPFSVDREAAKVVHDKAVALKAALARDAGEWFDIFEEIVVFGMKDVLESTGQGFSVVEKLKEQQPYFAKVRRELVAHGLPITEDVDWEGPETFTDSMGNPNNVTWPRGEWIKLYWPDGSMLEFRGQAALTALSFIMWWANFTKATSAIVGQDQVETKRMVQPGSPEWNSFFSAKKRDGM